MLHKIIKIVSIEPFTVVCEFNSHEIKEIDFSGCVKEFQLQNNGWTSRLADPSLFKTARVAEYGTLVWGNDIDFDPEVLYRMGKEVVNP